MRADGSPEKHISYMMDHILFATKKPNAYTVENENGDAVFSIQSY